MGVEQKELDATEEAIGQSGQYVDTILTIITTPMAIILKIITPVQPAHGHVKATDLMLSKRMKWEEAPGTGSWCSDMRSVLELKIVNLIRRVTPAPN